MAEPSLMAWAPWGSLGPPGEPPWGALAGGLRTQVGVSQLRARASPGGSQSKNLEILKTKKNQGKLQRSQLNSDNLFPKGTENQVPRL